MSEFQDGDALFQTVATIFAATVLLDKRERDPELIEFTHACMVHNHKIRPGTILPRQTLQAWFNQHKGDLSATLSGPDAHDFKIELLSRISAPELQRSVLSSIFTISVADYELHDEETEFIQTALSVWNAEVPRIEELAAVG